MLDGKRKQLREEIARKQKELDKIEALPDLTSLVDGSVVALFVRHGVSKPYTYIAYLTSSRFYLTGSNSPNAITVDQLGDWLTTGGRRLIQAVVVGVVVNDKLSPVFDLGAALLDSMREEAPFWSKHHQSQFGD